MKKLRAVVDIGNVAYSSFDRGRPLENAGYRIDFDVNLSLRSAPNKSTVTIFNVDRNDALGFIANRKEASVRLFAADTPSDPVLLSLGDPIKEGITHKQTIDSPLRLVYMDALKKKQTARISVSFRGATKLSEVIREAASQMGLPMGAIRLDQDLTLRRGFSMTGGSFEVFQRLARMARCDFSVQNGEIVFLGQNQFSREKARLYTYQNGSLLAAPEPRAKGRIMFHTVLDPDMRPGVAFGARDGGYSDGFYKAITVQHTGSTWSGGKTIIEAKQLDTVNKEFVLIS